MWFKKKKERNGVVLRRHCFFFFFPWTCSRGRKVLFSSPCLFLPRVLELKSDATHLMMRCQSSRVPQATPPLAIAVGAVAEQATCTPCIGGDGMGQGRPRSPCLYKYHPNAEEKGGEKKRTAEKRKGDRERESDRFLGRKERPKERNRRVFEREKGREEERQRREREDNGETKKTVASA